MVYEESITAPSWIRWALIMSIGLILLGVVLVTAFNRLTLTGDIIYYASMGVTLALLLILLRNFTRMSITVTDSEVTFAAGRTTKSIAMTDVVSCSEATSGAHEGGMSLGRFLFRSARGSTTSLESAGVSSWKCGRRARGATTSSRPPTPKRSRRTSTRGFRQASGPTAGPSSVPRPRRALHDGLFARIPIASEPYHPP